MTDVHTKQQRSKNMAAIRSRGNKSTEVAFLSLLKESRIKGWRRHYNIEGYPDLAFPKQKVAIFLDGCFWHGCKKCMVKPKSNIEFWEKKIQQNKKRDSEVNKILKGIGWKVIRIWEHELLEKRDKIVSKVVAFLKEKHRLKRICCQRYEQN